MVDNIIKLINEEIEFQKSKLTLDFEKDRKTDGIIIELEDTIERLNKLNKR